MRVFIAKAVYGQEEIDAVNEVLNDRPLTLMGGKSVSAFESTVANLFGKRYGLMVNSGSSANLLAIAAIGLPAGAEVVTPALTFSTTVAPLLQNGLVPVFVDVEHDTFVADAARVEELIGPKVRALMIPNLIGNLPEWAILREIADRHDLVVIEDSADTLGSLYRDAPTGMLTDISTTSFYASHVITCAGFGGMACFNDRELARKAKLLRGWGRRSTLTGESECIEDRFDTEINGTEYDSKFVFEVPGYNFLPSEVGAAFGVAQLAKLDRFTQIRRRNFAMLRSFFKEYEEFFVLPRQRQEVQTAWLSLPLIVRENAPFDRRDLQLHFERNDIQTRSVFTGNILRQPGFKDIVRREAPGGYPNADRVMRGGVLIGCHHGMTAEEITYVCETFRTFIHNL